MRVPFAPLAALYLGLAAPAQADEVKSSLHFIGDDICHRALDGKHAEFDAQEFREWLAADGRSVGSFCGCVADLYVSEGDRELLSDMQSELIGGESFFTINFTMFDNMSQCRAQFMEFDDLIDGDLLEVEFEADAQGIGIDHEDVRMCQLVLSGDVPFFNPEPISEHIRETGQNEGDVCACAAGYLAAQGEPLQEMIQSAANPEKIYSGALQSGVELCAGL